MERFKNILCVVNPGEKSSAVVQRAMGLAARQKTSLTLARIVEDTSSTFNDHGLHFDDDQRPETRTKFETVSNPLVEKSGFEGKPDVLVLRGIPFAEIVKQVRRGKHDLLIKPVEDSHNGRARLRITDKRLLRECPCPWIRIRVNQRHSSMT